MDPWRPRMPPMASTQVTGGTTARTGTIPTLDMSNITHDNTIRLHGSLARGGGRGACLGLMPLRFIRRLSSDLCHSLMRLASWKCFHQSQHHLHSLKTAYDRAVSTGAQEKTHPNMRRRMGCRKAMRIPGSKGKPFRPRSHSSQ